MNARPFPKIEPLEARIAPAFGAVFELSSLDGANGFKLSGASLDDESGFSVSGAGDINGDGIDDVIVGASHADPSGINTGASYVVFGKRGGLARNLDLSALTRSDGFRIDGAILNDELGYTVSGAGDVNDDGIDDLIIGAFEAAPHGLRSGASYVVFGSRSGFPANLDLATPLTGSNGFKISGVAMYDQSGFSVSGAGDVNGDGIDDVIVGARGADPHGESSGTSYVVFGKRSGFAANLDLSTLGGTNGFKIYGAATADYSGFSVSGAGDINGDGIDDVIVGARGAAPGGNAFAGASYVVFGKRVGSGTDVELATLAAGEGFKISGVAAGDNSGVSVSGAGDINGDGIDDLVIGAYTAGGAGAGYVVFGSRSSFGTNLNLSTLSGGNGFKISAEAPADFLGVSVSGAGDINGDGIDDLIVGAHLADPNGGNSGASYVVFGSRGGFLGNLNVSTLTGPNGFQINGVAGLDYAGVAVSGAGDVNGDGIADVIIGAFKADPNGDKSGASYVVFGQPAVPRPVLSIDDVTVNEAAGTATFRVTLSAPSGQPVRVDYATSDGMATAGADFTSASGTLVIPAGTTTQTIIVPILNDTGFENTETFNLNLSGPFNATIADNLGVGTILDNDAPLVGALSIADVTLNEAAGTATFTVTLSAASAQAVSVNFATGGGTATAGADYTSVNGTLNFPAGTTTQTIAVPITGEAIFELDETFFINLSAPSGAILGDGQGQGTIVNDDATPVLQIANVTVAEANGGTTPATFTVTLSNPSSQIITVQYLTVDGSATSAAVGNDFTAAPLSTLTFAPGEVSQTVVIAVSGDAEPEPNDTFFLDFSAPANAALPNPRAQGTIVNDDLVVTPMPNGGSTVEVTDTDGDKVIVSSNQGVFIEDEFIFAPDGSLAMIELAGNTRFTGANVTIRTEQAGGGDGRVEIGMLNATGMDLKNVSVQGSLGQIMVGDGNPSRPALKSLTVDSLGTADAVDRPLVSQINGALGKLIVSGDVNQASFTVLGRIGSVTIGGNLAGKAGSGAGTRVTAALRARGGLAALGLTTGVAEVTADSMGDFTLVGKVSDAVIAANGTIDSLTVRGDVAAGTVVAAARVPVLKVLGNLVSDDPANPAIFALVARGSAYPAIDRLVVRGDVRNARFLFGYKSRILDGSVPEGEPAVLPKNADASVGKIKINGNWSASSLVAGVLDATGDGFGQNDTLFAGDRTPEIAARIASIVIKGTAIGSVEKGDHFGISAQSIGKLSIGGVSIELKKNRRDDVALDQENGDFKLLEI